MSLPSLPTVQKLQAALHAKAKGEPYMRRFVLGWKVLGHEQRLDSRIVNYADDFVLCCRGTASEAMLVMRNMMTRLKLTVNETKTHICRVPDESFDFLGYTFGRWHSPKTGQAYLGMGPSKKKILQLAAGSVR